MRELYLIEDAIGEFNDYIKITEEQYNFFVWLQDKEYIKSGVTIEKADEITCDEP